MQHDDCSKAAGKVGQGTKPEHARGQANQARTLLSEARAPPVRLPARPGSAGCADVDVSAWMRPRSVSTISFPPRFSTFLISALLPEAKSTTVPVINPDDHCTDEIFSIGKSSDCCETSPCTRNSARRSVRTR